MLSRLAPDGKIYIAGFTSLDGIHVIHNPDLKGEACDVEQLGLRFPLDMDHLSGLPNNPWYGTLPDNTLCDSLLSVSVNEVSNLGKEITLHPNPTQDQVTLTAPPDLLIDRIELLDTQGRTHNSFYENSSEVRLDLSGYPTGLYFVSIYTEKGRVVKKIVRE